MMSWCPGLDPGVLGFWDVRVFSSFALSVIWLCILDCWCLAFCCFLVFRCLVCFPSPWCKFLCLYYLKILKFIMCFVGLWLPFGFQMGFKLELLSLLFMISIFLSLCSSSSTALVDDVFLFCSFFFVFACFLSLCQVLVFESWSQF